MDTKNSNLVEGSAGSDTKTIDMSGTNMAGATNSKNIEERVSDGATKNVDVSTANITTAKKVKIMLSRPIVNNGIEYDAGDTLEVKESTATYLRGLGYCKEV